MTQPFIELRDVVKIYEKKAIGQKILALRGIELMVDRGEFVAIIGPSGAGKSTLLKLIGGIDQPSSGIVRVAGLEIQRLPPWKLTDFRRSTVGFLWQLPEENLMPELSALENVEFPMLFTSMSREQRIKRARELLARVGLAARETHHLGQLSGGEAQRVGLAVALANDPEVVLCDEPTGELDSLTTMEIIEFFKEMNEEFGKTMIVVTHDMRFEKQTDRAYRILDGMISGMRKTSKEKPGVREELTVVDSYGNLRLPRGVIDSLKIKRHAKIRLLPDHARIYPVEEDVIPSEKRENK